MRHSHGNRATFWSLAALVASAPLAATAQVPVDDDGQPIEATAAEDTIPLLSVTDLEDLVGPIALYPDDLLAIVLPASTYPLQVVQAARFLEQVEDEPSLKPDESWNDAVVALLNYPEVVAQLSDDIDWTWRLGEAVVAQQDDVIDAVEAFRDRAYAAGNLESDEYQTVTEEDGIIHIEPVEDDVIYVPYYEPREVVVYQPRPVYHYYPDPCPVYYYPYSSNYAFRRGYFWGVTTAFSVGWFTNRLHVYHPTYYGHPYYGRYYWGDWWYRRPSVTVYNNTYVNYGGNYYGNRYRHGDYWRPHNRRSVSVSNRRVTRSHYYPGSRGYDSDNVVPRSRSQSRSRNLTGSVNRNAVRREDSTRRAPQASTRQPSRTTRDSVARNERRTDTRPNTSSRQATRNNTRRQPAERPESNRSNSGRSEAIREQLRRGENRRSENRRTQFASNGSRGSTRNSNARRDSTSGNRTAQPQRSERQRSTARRDTSNVRRESSSRQNRSQPQRSQRQQVARNDSQRQSRNTHRQSNSGSRSRSSENRGSRSSKSESRRESRSSRSSGNSRRDARRR